MTRISSFRKRSEKDIKDDKDAVRKRLENNNCDDRDNLCTFSDSKIFNDDGTMTDSCGPLFAGKPRFIARKLVVEELKRLKLFKYTKPRSGDVVEKFLRPQWYMNCKSMANEASTRW